MMADLHSGLRELLYRRGNLRPEEVGIAFEAPTREWVSTLVVPTVNLFLFSVQENVEKRETNMQLTRSGSRAERRLPPRRMDLHFMVSVAAPEIEDEHALLWKVLATLMKYPQLSSELLSDALAALDPPLGSRIGQMEDNSRILDLWNNLGTPPHPAVCYIVTAPLDLDVVIEAPLVFTSTTRYETSRTGEPYSSRIQIGGVVRDRQGRPLAGITVGIENRAESSTTNPEGRFVLRGVPEGRVGLNLSENGKSKKRVEVSVPAESYELVLDE
jgi:hypothetical protein